MTIKPLIDCVLLSRGKILLVKYAFMPDSEGGWFLPGDMLQTFENPKAAIKRILSDQFQWQDVSGEIRDVESFRGNDGSWHLALHVLAEIDDPPPVTASEDVSANEWFPLEHLPARSQVAHGGWAITVVRRILKGP